jgi:hypothetical protein
LNRFRVAFGSVLLVALATSLLAGWGVISQSSPGLISSESGTSASSTATNTSTAQETATSTTTAGSTSVAESGSTTTQTSAASSQPSTGPTTGTSTLTETATTTVVMTTTTTTRSSGQSAVSSATTVTTTQSSRGSLSLSGYGFFGAGSTQVESPLRDVQASSLVLAPACWIVLAGMWMWRGRVRARYSEMGFGSDVFELFMKMKGGATRIKVLNTLSTPKDRLQLAQELGIDWKAVDRHVQILNKYGFISEQAAYGTVRLYQVTPMGKMLLNLFDDLERTDGQTAHPSLSKSGEGHQPDS